MLVDLKRGLEGGLGPKFRFWKWFGNATIYSEFVFFDKILEKKISEFYK